jgi:transcriptional regulator with XRE-family HTH domain
MTTSRRGALRAADRARTTLRDDLDRLRLDAGWSIAELARAAALDPAFVHRVISGDNGASVDTYARLATALGANLSARVFPNTGPMLRDHTAAPMLEHLIVTRHPRWPVFTEVVVRRPSRGAIDAVLHEPRESIAVATELQGQLRRLEQQIRWHAMKAESLPSWDGWAHLGQPEPVIGQLLIVRRTRATRAVASEFARQLRTAYPAHPDDALASLTRTEPWPGDALMWMVLERGEARWARGR